MDITEENQILISELNSIQNGLDNIKSAKESDTGFSIEVSYRNFRDSIVDRDIANSITNEELTLELIEVMEKHMKEKYSKLTAEFIELNKLDK